MIKKNFPENIVVDHGKLNGVLKLMDQFEDIIVLLDDAYQHRSIKRV